MKDKKVKAIARYVPVLGWLAQPDNDSKELELLQIKPQKNNLKDGQEIIGKIVNGLFELEKL